MPMNAVERYSHYTTTTTLELQSIIRFIRIIL